MRTSVLAIALAVSLAGCGSAENMSANFRQAQEVAADLESAVGSKPFVGFDWQNGSLGNVSVTFEGIPASKSAQEIVGLAQRSIAQRFGQQPRQVILSFAVEGLAR